MLYDHALHSISIFTMFHAFRCVLDCWKCVLVGLDWFSTHDAIIFSTSHVHAFIPFLFFLFALLWLCSVSFSLSLSLSLFLSLSLLDRLHMAPKHKSNPSQDPFRFGSSSSFDLPIPLLHIRFCDWIYVRFPLGVPSCSYRSFTPICTVSIPLYLSLPRYSEVHVS